MARGQASGSGRKGGIVKTSDVVTIVLAILEGMFGFWQLARQDIKDIEAEVRVLRDSVSSLRRNFDGLDRRIIDVRETIDAQFNDISPRFDLLDERFDMFNTQFMDLSDLMHSNPPMNPYMDPTVWTDTIPHDR